MAELSRHLKVEKTILSPKSGIIQADEKPLPDTSHWIVDSLLLANHSFLDDMSRSTKSGEKWLLVHYLKILDPQNQSDSEIGQLREKLSNFDGFIVTSQFSKQMLIRSGISARNIAVIQPGIVNRDRSNRKQRLSIQLLTVSSIYPGKGLLEFFPILENISDLPWQWILVGEDKLDPEFVRKFMKKLNHFRLKERVRILGPISSMNLLEIYKQSDIFVLNSQFESCSMATMEAMSFGLPVIVNRVGGLPELVDHEKNGYLIPLGNTQLFSDSLRNLMSRPELRLSVGENAYRRSLSFPAWQESVEKFIEFINPEAKC
jgi:glycosyltransferase involved in cell wall biosynthesis